MVSLARNFLKNPRLWLKMSWQQPKTVNFPQVWSTFDAKDPDSGRIVKYRIQDLPEERFDEAIHLLGTKYVQNEPTLQSLDIFNDPTFNATTTWTDTLKQKLSIVCFKDSSNEICGLITIKISEVDEEDFYEQITCKNVKEIVKVMNYVTEKADPFNRHGKVNKFLEPQSLLVIPKYRGLGISNEIFKATIPIAKALDLKVLGAVFTSIGSQKAAANAGYIEDFSVMFKDLKKHGDFIEFPNISSPSINFMSRRLD